MPEKIKHKIKKPKITAFMAVYNGEKYLRFAIESILNQTFNDFELLIINDGSKDKSVEIIKSYHDPRIRLIDNKKNYGLVYTRNLGLTESKGEYIAIMDCDDISKPTRFEKQVSFMEKHPNVGICGSWTKSIGEVPGIINTYYTKSDEIKASLLFYTGFANPSVIVRKSTTDRYQLRYDTEHKYYYEDYGFWLNAAHFTDFANIPEVLLFYRVYKKSFSHTFREENNAGVNNLQKILIKSLDIIPSNNELQIHTSRFPKKEETLYGFLDNLEKWLIKIIEANKKTSIYHQNSLEKIIYERWELVCWFNAISKVFVFKTYITSPLFWLGGLKKYSDGIKIFRRCLLRK